MNVCPLSLDLLADEGAFSAAAARRLFGVDALPTVDIDLARMHTVGLAMVGRTSISGVQRKLSLGLDAERMTLRLQAVGRQFILKPASDRFPELPENEHVTMRLAALCGLDVPEHGTLLLADGSRAYIVARFDRPPAGGKRAVEDFCALSLRYPADKYRGSAELCARVVRRYATAPLVTMRKLFRQLLFAWWTGNGDLHLKNLSLWRDDQGAIDLSPSYDLVNTRLILPGDRLALPVGGRDDRLTVRAWRDFGAYTQLPARVVQREAASMLGRLDAALAMVARSFLGADARQAYAALLAERANVLAELAESAKHKA